MVKRDGLIVGKENHARIWWILLATVVAVGSLLWVLRS
jgi:hypothetical protein